MRALVIRALAGLVFAVSLQIGAAWACTPLPNTLTNGTTADATQVMADFNGILSCPLVTGPVGIDTATPAVLLDVTGNSASASAGTQDVLHLTRPAVGSVSWAQLAAFQIGTYNTTGGLGPDTRLDINLKANANVNLTGDTNVMTLLSNGNVGIGTTTPAVLLDTTGSLASNVAGTQDVFHLTRPLQTSVSYPQLAAFQIGTYNTGGTDVPDTRLDINLKAAATTSLTGDVNVMTLLSNGNVGIGTTTPSMPLFVNGQAGGTTGWSNTSDGRLKQSITTIPDALSTIERLRGVEFYWRPPSERPVGKALALPLGEQQVGFVAQEVEKVVPEAVSTPAAGSDGAYGVNEAKIVAILVEAVKEQQVEIASQSAEIAKLKAMLGGTTSSASAAGN
jgi:hypothetical protein